MSDGLKRTLVVLANVIPLLGLLAWPIMVFMTFFFFDAPGSEQSTPTWVLAMSIWGYPVPVIVGGIITIRAFRSGNHGRCALGTAISFGVMFGVLEWMCGGQFSC